MFSQIDAEQFQAAFLSWVQAVFAASKGQVVAIDGKQLRRSHDERLGKAAIHMLSAWSSTNHVTLGQRKVAEKSNEITAKGFPLFPKVGIKAKRKCAGWNHEYLLKVLAI